MSSQTEDEEAILKATVDFQNAWNAADIEGLLSFFDENCLRVGAFGEVQSGKEEIAAGYAQLIKTELPGSKVLHEKGRVRFFSDDLATWQAAYEIFSSGANSIKGYTNAIFRKQGKKWLIVEIHARIFPII